MRQGDRLPKEYEKDIHRAVEILREAGCAQIFLFGSLSSKTDREGSDIDLAVRGCPRGQFYHLLGKLMLELDHPVDLVNLESTDDFAHYLEEKGELLQVG